ncbi:MAG: nuclear transport factor 2 family protein [Flavobacteriales bacterium]|nr:nuclear transport factor 2 family protein [Flavobacteriales bacterium]MBK6945675.1 nuclear transport factor 2 family protein [Flavobacteriales bacterium]MBK7241780.1 nuclear transport factor 2 family protein [Flavobacteriales bacterium]MBK7296213.1 nuclear transport factor 2 family protein [Flavobacteriales bacterium]MBK9534772.1 nuclear transport factor 2 family protein [Flavobacteriales bacterium]
MKFEKIVFALALPSLLLLACSTPPPCPPVEEHFVHPLSSIPAAADANIAVVESYLNGLLKADAAAIRAACAPGFYANNTFTPSDSSDVEGIIEMWAKNDSTRSDQKLRKVFAECVSVAAGDEYAGDWVHFWGDYSAKDNATGKSYTVPFFYDARVESGKITKSYMYYDRLSVYHQLGTTPPAPKAKKEEKK